MQHAGVKVEQRQKGKPEEAVEPSERDRQSGHVSALPLTSAPVFPCASLLPGLDLLLLSPKAGSLPLHCHPPAPTHLFPIYSLNYTR